MSRVFIISAPSGSGKSTLVNNLLQRDPNLSFSVSYTTRQPRGQERSGEQYHFTTREDFEKMIAAGEFLEWADVFGNYYGTRRRDTQRLLDSGLDVALVIDVQGAVQVRNRCADVISVFVLPPSYAALERRMWGGPQESQGGLARPRGGGGLVARQEVDRYAEYDYVVVNDDIGPCVDRLRAIVLAERSRRQGMAVDAEAIVATFDSSTPGQSGQRPWSTS